MRSNSFTKKIQGFTLLEVLITVTIIGILSGIATMGYQRYVYRANRTEAKAILLDISQRAERFYTDNNTYTGYSIPTNLRQVPEQGNKTYDVSFTTGSSGQTFTVSATPKNRQVKDTCGTMSINNIGRKSASGSSLDGSRCW